MPANDLALLTEVALAAGEEARRFFGGRNESWEKPDGAGPVTEADLAVDALLNRHLLAERPGYGWLSEETEDSAERLNHDRVFVVDPIDGTRSFKQGSRTWAHSIAVVENGIATAGVVYLPMRDMLFSAAAGQGAFLNGEPLRVAGRSDLQEADFLAARPALDQRHWAASPPDFTRSYRPSLAYRMALVAQGRFDGMITLRRAWEWDIAAGDIIQREAGAISSDRTGAPLRFNNAHPTLDGVVAANAALHGQVIAALATA